MPLAAKQLTRLFPRLWGTAKAAKRWLEKEPLKPNRDIIRDYRPPGQTSWSRALVRHGAGPASALAKVLGVAAENIQVRGAARPEPPVKANTAPSPVPNTPSSSTEPAVQRSNAVPDFPSGDN